MIDLFGCPPGIRTTIIINGLHLHNHNVRTNMHTKACDCVSGILTAFSFGIQVVWLDGPGTQRASAGR